ncbi:two-component-system connector protein YcgZ [Erwinia pyri]|uniref:Two-component-system connector protein YcgZ n=1 Tax=Erwinia pyri TaxID=3062598 RepID=A0AA50DH86_9GAMM|nr:two-component-system connector protein YcgZ [Erwinia sp. DE2]WLS77907.1 two-component-system connector protein YcgZ [Erwinia sp. DE2]
MHHNRFNAELSSDSANDFSVNEGEYASLEQTLGQVVMEILQGGMAVNRPSICTKLLARLSESTTPDQEKHHKELISLLFGREK